MADVKVSQASVMGLFEMAHELELTRHQRMNSACPDATQS
jgi:hypothetical protein